MAFRGKCLSVQPTGPPLRRGVCHQPLGDGEIGRDARSMDTLPFTTVSQALQAAFEALNALTDSVPAHKRPKFEETVKRVSRARVTIDTWVDEQR